MKIEHYLSQLLFRYQCVTVPGFGAFLTEIQSAQVNDGTHGFNPPKKLVSFNGYLKNNDGLLATHISQSERISYESAVDLIQKEVSLWRIALQNNQSVSLTNIGTLALNFEGGLVFEANNQTNYFTASFGLSSFVSPAIIRQAAVESTVEDEKPVIDLMPQKQKTNYLKYAAIFVVGLGTAGFFGNNYYQQQITAQTQLVQTEVQKEVQGKIQEATFVISNPLPDVTLTVKQPKMPYHIVAGAFRNEENAQKIYDKLVGLGYKARRMEKNRFGLFPVLFGSYTTYGEAQSALTEIHKTQNPDAWLLVRKF
ncbi:MAG: sporulation protein [Flavobacterium sp. BFFFF1]|uniref:HU domain-containing protein n=1 Tax=unclassified Flavobacterium TaxID=196869 RepID=UPI000BD8C10F|nr:MULTISPECIES: SPOR domain-containing protein [unclassified Flavobacterium]OYU80954.1 MAG: sporulation protein [Flavobacterium sp. BFFFF1]